MEAERGKKRVEKRKEEEVDFQKRKKIERTPERKNKGKNLCKENIVGESLDMEMMVRMIVEIQGGQLKDLEKKLEKKDSEMEEK